MRQYEVCVFSGCTPCYKSVYQCGLWSIVQDWRFVLTGLWEGCVCVFVIKSLCRLWVFSVVVR